MFTEITISAVIFSFFIVLLWRLNRGKKSKKVVLTNAHYLTSAPPQNVAQHKDASLLVTKTFSGEDFIKTELLAQLNYFREAKAPNQVQAIEQLCLQFNKPHPLLLPLTQAAFEPNELFELIKTDPQMTAKVLKRVNSPAFGLLQPITSIHHAIIYLGVGTVKHIALHYAIENKKEFDSKNQAMAYQKLWNASYLASALVLLLAKELRLDEGAELSTSCLLSYLGDMALLSSDVNFADLYLTPLSLLARVNHYQQALMLNPQLISQALVRHWQLPRVLVHHIDDAWLPLSQNLNYEDKTKVMLKTGLLYLASRLADCATFERHSTLDQILTSLSSQGDLHNLLCATSSSTAQELLTLVNSAMVASKINQLLTQLSSK